MANIIGRALASLGLQPFNKPQQIQDNFRNMGPFVNSRVTPIYPQANMLQFVDAYISNATVYTIVSLMARKFGFIDRFLYKINEEDKGAKMARKSYRNQIRSRDPRMSAAKMKGLIKKAYEDEVEDNDPLQQLLLHPNKDQGQDSFYAALYTYKKLTGNSFEWLNRGDIDEVEGEDRLDYPIYSRYILPSQYVTLIVDRTMFPYEITGYQFWGSGGIPIYIPKEDIIHWKDPNPVYDSYNFQQLYGLSPLYPALKLIAQDDAAMDASVAMFQNGGARGVLYNKTFDNLNEQQRKAADKAIDTKINNKQMKSAVAMLPGDWGYLFTGESAVDMQLLDAQNKVFDRICNLLGCNPTIFGSEDTTFNNVEQARKDLITNAILPDCASFRDEENRVLLRAFNKNPQEYCIDIDVTDLPELADDMEKLTKRVMDNWTLTVNEKRQELGFDPITTPEGEIMFMPSTLIPMEDAAVSSQQLMADSGDTGGGDPNSGDPVPDPRTGQAGVGNNKDLSIGQSYDYWRQRCLPG